VNVAKGNAGATRLKNPLSGDLFFYEGNQNRRCVNACTRGYSAPRMESPTLTVKNRDTIPREESHQRASPPRAACRAGKTPESTLPASYRPGKKGIPALLKPVNLATALTTTEQARRLRYALSIRCGHERARESTSKTAHEGSCRTGNERKLKKFDMEQLMRFKKK